MGPLTFLHPAVLGALALVGIPFLIHLVRQRRPRVVPWAAWQFLVAARSARRRRLRLEQLALLLLRALIVAAAVLAFARPVVRESPALAGSAPVHVILAIDVSYSMARRIGDSTALERARSVADRIVSRVLREGDRASLLLVSSRPEALVREPTLSRSLLRARLRTVRVSDFATDYDTSAAACADVARLSRGMQREVYWITDSQKAGFARGRPASASSTWSDLARLARIVWVHIGAPAEVNLAVGPPEFSRALVTPGTPVRLEAPVTNHGTERQSGVLADLDVDGRRMGSATLSLEPGRPARATFLVPFTRSGLHTGVVRLRRRDALDVDDQAAFAVQVRERLRVLVWNTRPTGNPLTDESFYLTTALAPAGASEGAADKVQVDVQQGGPITARDLRLYDAVVVCGAVPIASSARDALARYVRAGGGLLLLPAPWTDGRAVSASWERGERLLPARMAAVRRLDEASAPAIEVASITHPALEPLRSVEEANLGSARLTVTHDLVVPSGDSASRIVCRLTDGRPALVERSVGEGRVVLAAFSAGASGGTLPYRPTFVPLVHQLAAYLGSGRLGQRHWQVGEPATVRLPLTTAGRALVLRRPDGGAETVHGTVGSEGVSVTIRSTERAGLYRLVDGARELDGFAVQRDVRESDLTPLDARAIERTLGVPARVISDAGDIAAAVRSVRHGTELWRPLVWAALGLLALEALLAQRFGRRS